MAQIQNFRAPDFIIAGGMKCGTTTLHQVLASHPQVFLPESEIFFFDFDDWMEHRICLTQRGKCCYAPKFNPKDPELLAWYDQFFAEAQPRQLLGEDSTTYLASRLAPKRIAELLPEVKILLLLRDPTSRLYSQYWHMVRNGWTGKTLAQLLRSDPSILLNRSCYLSQIARYQQEFPKERLLILSFEEFVSDLQKKVGEVQQFLGLPKLIDVKSVKSHSNRGAAPVMLGPHLWFNRVLSDLPASRYDQQFRLLPRASNAKLALLKLVNKVRLRLNPFSKPVPPLDKATHQLLDKYLQQANDGIDDLVGFPISRQWYKSL